MIETAIPEESFKTCFVACPIGEENSSTRHHADWLFEEIIQPTFATHFPNFRVDRADKMTAPGMIDTQIINHLVDADLVIVDLSELNPNAFYEMGIRHTVKRPTIHMFLEGTPLPFDVRAFRSIPFSLRNPAALRHARSILKQFVEEALKDGFEISNPFTMARTINSQAEDSPPIVQMLIAQNADLEGRLRLLERDHDPVGYTTSGGFGYATLSPSSTGTIVFSADISDHQFNISHSAAAGAFTRYLVGSRIGDRSFEFTLNLPSKVDPETYVLRTVGHYTDLERIEVNGREIFRQGRGLSKRSEFEDLVN